MAVGTPELEALLTAVAPNLKWTRLVGARLWRLNQKMLWSVGGATIGSARVAMDGAFQALLIKGPGLME